MKEKKIPVKFKERILAKYKGKEPDDVIDEDYYWEDFFRLKRGRTLRIHYDIYGRYPPVIFIMYE